MTVKVMLLKSGEDVISDAQEIRDKETNNIVAYYLRNPYCMEMTTTPIETDEDLSPEELENQPQVKISVAYTHWAPLSKQRDFYIPADWTVTIYDPHDNIMTDYCAKHPPVEVSDEPTDEPATVTPTEVVGEVNEPETAAVN
jgi:hypothetical protein